MEAGLPIDFGQLGQLGLLGESIAVMLVYIVTCSAGAIQSLLMMIYRGHLNLILN